MREQLRGLRYAVTHPFSGFDELKYRKGGSLSIAAALIAGLFLALVLSDRAAGFGFRGAPESVFRVMPYLTKSVLVFGAWVLANTAVSTFLDGEGRAKTVLIYSAYALTPFILSSLLCTALSNILTRDEAVFIEVPALLGVCWSALLLFSAVRSAHGYSAARTFGAVLLTLAGMAVLFFLFTLLLSLIQNLLVFLYTIATEILYRIRN